MRSTLRYWRRFAEAVKPRPSSAGEQELQLRALIAEGARCRFEIDHLSRNRLRTYLRPHIEAHIAWLIEGRGGSTVQIKEFIRSALCGEPKTICSPAFPESETLVSSVIMAELPELGRLNRRESHALIRSGPFRDSGQFRGR